MKKLFAFSMAVAIMAGMAVPSFAQECRRRTYRTYYEPARSSRVYYDNSRVYYDNPQAYYDYSNRYRGRSFWDRHRDKLTLAMGTGGGAALGLIGGRRGAAIGGLSGLAGSAVYAYRIRNRRYRY